MASMKRPRLSAVLALPNFQLKLTFIDGSSSILNFIPLFEDSPGLEPLRKSKAFSKVTLADSEGWAAEWLELDIQIGADTLWLDAQAQNAIDENTRIFTQWRARHGLSLNQAAEALGMTARTMSSYGTGARPVPRYIALACKGWEVEYANTHEV